MTRGKRQPKLFLPLFQETVYDHRCFHNTGSWCIAALAPCHCLPDMAVYLHCPCEGHGRGHRALHSRINLACLRQTASLVLLHSWVSACLWGIGMLCQIEKEGEVHSCEPAVPSAHDHHLWLQIMEMPCPFSSSILWFGGCFCAAEFLGRPVCGWKG